MTRQIIGELRAAAMEDPQNSSRIRQLQTSLAQLGNEVIEELHSLLNDSFLRVGEAAADVLVLIASKEAYDALLNYALDHLHDRAGRTKFPGPGWIRLRELGKHVLPAMARHYDSSLPLDTRLAMIFIAQQIGDPSAQPLIHRALSEPDSRVVEAAGEALGSIDGPDAWAMSEASDDWETRQQCSCSSTRWSRPPILLSLRGEPLEATKN